MGEFLCRHFNIEDGRNYATLQHIMLYYFKKGKNATEVQKKKRFVRSVEKVLWLIEYVKSGFRSFMPEISCWTTLQGPVGQWKLERSNWDINWEKQHYIMQEIADRLKIPQSTKLLVKMKNVSYFTEKTKQTFWTTQ